MGNQLINWGKLIENVVGGKPRNGLVKLLEKAYGGCGEVNREYSSRVLINCGRRVHLILSMPTGYGKSTISLVLGKLLEDHTFNHFIRLIHVAPTKSLIEDLGDRASKANLRHFTQYSLAPHESKAPFFLPNFIITTYDSFMLNMYKASVGEPNSKYGHFELPRYSIYTSIIHFDEYHLLSFSDDSSIVDSGKAWVTLLTTIRLLVNSGVPLILSTATPNRITENELIRELLAYDPESMIYDVHVVSKWGEALKDRECKLINGDDDLREYQCTINGANYNLIELLFKEKLPNLETTIINLNNEDLGPLVDAVGKLLGEKPKCQCSPQVLVVANTVSEAIEWFNLIRNKVGELGLRDNEVCLIHSRFTIKDRESKVSKINKGYCKVLVATQVIEVGVDLNACNIVTEAAPLPAVVQRIGRVLRRGCGEATGKVIIVNTGKYRPYGKEPIEKALNAIVNVKGEVCWKMPYGCIGKVGYMDLVERIYSNPPSVDDVELSQYLMGLDLNIFMSRRDLKKLLRQYCSLVREDALITVYVPHGLGNNPEDNVKLNDLIPMMMTINSSTLYSLIKANNDDICRVLQCSNNGLLAVFHVRDINGSDYVAQLPDLRLLRIIRNAYENALKKKSTKYFSTVICRELSEYWTTTSNGELHGLIALILNPSMYNSEVGVV